MNSIVLAKGSLTDIEDTKYESAVKALEVLNIVDGYEDGEYKANKLVTRAEMAKLLVIATGKDNTAKISLNASTFNDVAANHWALGYINVASQCGFINGYPDGSFKPDETINYAEAATMALRALGYDIALEGRGTWPTNYLGKAQELEIEAYNEKNHKGLLRHIVFRISKKTNETLITFVLNDNKINEKIKK